FVSEDTLKPFYLGSQSTVTIQENGYARWFKLPEAAAGKKLTVTSMPKHASFTVYNELGQPIQYMVSSAAKKGIELQSSGTIVFAGEAGAKFEIKMN
ncbi:MAG: serine hydrolase, partial [Paenibacillus sp.]